MNESSIARQAIRLEQLEPRYLLSSMPLVMIQAPISDLSGQNRSQSFLDHFAPSNAASQRIENRNTVDGYLPSHTPGSGSPFSREPSPGAIGLANSPGQGNLNLGSSPLSESKGRPADRDDPDGDGDDDYNHAADRDDFQIALMPSQPSPQSAFVLARTLSNGNPTVAAGDQDSGLLASVGPIGFGRVSMESPMDTAFALQARAAGSRFANSATDLSPQIAGSLAPNPNLSGMTKPSEPPSPEPSARPAASASSADRWAIRLVNVLGDLSTVDAGILEQSIRQFLDHVQDVTRATRGESNEDSIVPWIVAAAVAGLACEIGRRQMHRATLRANREDKMHGLRDFLFLNLDRGHE